MSTRSTIWYREETIDNYGLHLYHELMDDNFQPHLEITCGPFCCIVRIPDELIQKLTLSRPDVPEERSK
jgi:hypothetical protein